MTSEVIIDQEFRVCCGEQEELIHSLKELSSQVHPGAICLKEDLSVCCADHQADIIISSIDLWEGELPLKELVNHGLGFLLIVEVADQFYLVAARRGTFKKVITWARKQQNYWSLRADLEPYESFRKLLNRVSDGVLELDANDKIRWANHAICVALGEKNLIGKSLQDIIRKQDVGRIRNLRVQQESGILVSFPVQLNNGQMVEIDPRPRLSEQNELLSYSVVVRRLHDDKASLSHGRDLYTLYALASAITQAGTFPEIIRTLLDKISDLLGWRFMGFLPASMLSQQGAYQRGGPESEGVAAWVEAWYSTMSLGKVAVLKTLEKSPIPTTVLNELSIRSIVAIPLSGGEGVLGLLWFASKQEGEFSREKVSLLVSIAHQVSAALENSIYIEAKLREEQDKRKFYRDALHAVTKGKLVFCEYDETDTMWLELGEPLGEIEVKENRDVTNSRHMTEKILTEQGLKEERVHDIALCVTEATGNVIKHADRGHVSIKKTKEALYVQISDKGPGIEFAHLPKAVLHGGFSTKVSLGMGYSILLEMADQVFLATGAEGTVIILEILLVEPDPLDAFASLLEGQEW